VSDEPTKPETPSSSTPQASDGAAPTAPDNPPAATPSEPVSAPPADPGAESPAKTSPAEAVADAGGTNAAPKPAKDPTPKPAKDTVSKAGPSKAGTSKAGTSKAGTSKAGTSKAGTSKAGTSKAGPAAGPSDAATGAYPTAPKEAASPRKTYSWGTGRRKASVARVRIRPGAGKFLIGKREIDDYFFDLRHRIDVVAPLKATDTFGKYDIFVNVGGGGQTGQAGAIRLGVARALMVEDPALEDTLRTGRFLTRDARKVERKKPGQPGARKRFQFSKR
jgi:small subunit ribosomal protein S9